MRAVAIACFFISGASGLIFQVIWTRHFSLVFGATTLAISTVLTAFMSGLALGSYLAGKYADRLSDPLKAYAAAEVGVGLAALALPAVVASFDGLNAALYRHYADNYFMLSAARFVASTLVIIVPTTLMGATLPLLSRYFVLTRAEHRRVGVRVGALYAINTFGAVLGTALGGFVLLPQLGLSTTNRLAASANLLLGAVVAVAYLIRKRRPPLPPPDPTVSELLEDIRAPGCAPKVDPLARKVALVAFAASGAAAMVYQVIWSRVLNMAIGSSVYSFTIVLTAFLIGLAGGAAVIGRLTARSENPVGLLAINHLVIVLLVGLSYLMMDRLGHIFVSFIGKGRLDASHILWSQFGISLLTMLPATVAMGGIFPLTIRIYASGVDRVGQDVGTAYSINTIGAIAGSFAAGFIAIPILQLQPGIYAAACINLAIAAVLAWLAPFRRSSTRWAALALVGIFALAGPLLPRWNMHFVTAGLFRPSVARDVIKTGKWEQPKMVYNHDGISTTVTVEQWSEEHFSLKNNGKVDASTGDDMPTQIAVGLLPLLLHPRAPRYTPEVALIGFASGVSAGAILQFPIKRLDVVELEPSILEASRFFNHVNHRPLQDRRATVLTDDGRNFLAATDRTYDVIVNEPSNPWITGVSNLFTRDYFEIGRRRLKRDGIFCTWAQLYEMGPRRVKSIYRSFASVFPYSYAFSAASLSSDTFLIGSNTPLKLDIRRLRRAFAITSVRKEMDRAQIESPHDLVALTLLAPGEIKAFVAGARLNTDDNALVEFGAPRDLYNHRRFDYYLSKIYGQSWLYGRIGNFIEGYRTSEDYAGLTRSLLVYGKFREAHVMYAHVKPKGGDISAMVHRLMDLLASRDVIDREFSLTETGPPLDPPRSPKKKLKKDVAEKIAREYTLVEEHLKRGDFRGALDLIEAWPDRACEEAGNDFQLLWGFVAYKTSNFHQAVNILEPLIDDLRFVKKRPVINYYLGRSYYGNADYRKAVRTLEQWIVHRLTVGKPSAPPLPNPDAPASTDRPATQAASQPASAPAPLPAK